MTTGRTSYARALAGYDDEHERALVEAITRSIFEASICSDARVAAIRTGQATSALVTVLAAVLAMSPAVTRSPTALRRSLDELHKRLRRRIAQVEGDHDLQDFLRRAFRSNDVGGHA